MDDQPKTLSELYPTKYLSAADLNDKTYVLKIDSVNLEKFPESYEPDQWKPVLTFSNAEKQMICNKTQAEAIGRLYGEIFAHWAGNRIAVNAGTARNGKPTINVTAPIVRNRIPDAEEEPEQ